MYRYSMVHVYTIQVVVILGVILQQYNIGNFTLRMFVRSGWQNLICRMKISEIDGQLHMHMMRPKRTASDYTDA